ncbi:MAG: haloacid dehalogenase [Desulfobacterales bacterium]|jgi:5'(3')-deoxyribonucleotidase
MMIDPASVAFDIDGVVADTMTLFLDIARQEYNLNSIQYSDITSYKLEECLDIDPEIIEAIVLRILDGNYQATLHPIAGAAEGLVKIQRHSNPILFITARPYPGPIQDWISQALQLDPASFEVIATGSHEAKADVLRQRKLSCFVDDRLETCFLLQDADVTPVLYRQPWNREQHPFVEVGSWDELQAIIAF